MSPIVPVPILAFDVPDPAKRAADALRRIERKHGALLALAPPALAEDLRLLRAFLTEAAEREAARSTP